jgi:glycosyltransferase involved in cell wall biosynthesis
MKKRVCFLIPSLNQGGCETYLLRFLRYSRNEIEPVVICRSLESGELYEKYLELDIKIVFQKVGFFNFYYWWLLYRFFAKNSFETVCDFTGNFAGITLWMANISGIKKRVVFYRQSTNHFFESKLNLLYNRFVNYLVIKNATRILSNSNEAFNFFFPGRNKNDNRYLVIRNGVESSQFENSINNSYSRSDFSIPEKAFVVGHVGRYDKSKNHQTILNVAAKLCSEYSDLYFIICGKDTELLRPGVLRFGLEDKVKLLGYKSDVHRIFKLFDVFYFPSITEGQPNALIEAMISGVPFVASDINPIQETIPVFLKHQLVPPMDVMAASYKIMEIYKGKNSDLIQKTKEWAKINYDPDKLFLQFFHNL